MSGKVHHGPHHPRPTGPGASVDQQTPISPDSSEVVEPLDSQVKQLAGLPSADDSPESPSILSWLFCLLIFFLGIGIFIFSLKDSSLKTTSELISPASTPTPAISPPNTQPPTPTLAKSTASVVVLNGTGIPGLAGRLKQKLQAIGYTDVSTGNTSQAQPGKNILSYKSGFESLAQDIVNQLSPNFNIQITNLLLPPSSEPDIEIILGQK